jgi:iron(III) transport system substrate-binding protein
MKRILAVLLLLAPAMAHAQTDAELYAAAKAEGVVNFAGALKQKETEKVLKGFEKQYPGVRVTYTRRSTEPMVQLIEAGRLAGRNDFDVINLTEPGEMLRYKKEGVLAATHPVANEDLLPGTFDPDYTFRSYAVTPMYGIVNTDKVKPEDRPKSLAELYTPKWKGRVAISQPSRGGTDSAALMAVADAIGPDFATRAKDLDILLTRGNEAAISAVISGERPVSWGVSGYRALDARADGSPLEIIFWKEGTAISSFYGGVMAKAPHPNAARLLDRWMMSKETQEKLIEADAIYSARRDITATPADEPPLSKLPIRFYTAQEVAERGQALAKQFDAALGVR